MSVGECLLHTSLMELAPITLDTTGGNNDKLGWLVPNGGVFTISLAYELEVADPKRVFGWAEI